MVREHPKFEELVGQTLVDVAYDEAAETIFFTTDGSKTYKLYHDQDCCESVGVEDICGSLNDLVGTSITQAEESSNEDWPADVEKSEYEPESCTWTFYRLATAKGSVVIRWFGASNGYYSESVTFAEE